MASLSESVVWLVSAEVAGRNVLVPVVYLSAADKKAIRNGALIAGTDVVANISGNLNNSGTIEGSNLVRLRAGGDVVNSGGGLITGGTVLATAARDIINRPGSTISGTNVGLTAGRDIILSAELTQTSETNNTKLNASGSRFSNATTTSSSAQGGTVSATNTLVLDAGRENSGDTIPISVSALSFW